jgi:hypothetical protein
MPGLSAKITVLILSYLFFCSGPVFSQTVSKPISTKSLAHLYEKMAQEPLLTDLDLTTYIHHLPLILELDSQPQKIMELSDATGWTEKRLTYSITKIGIGLYEIIESNNLSVLNPNNFPPFALPTQEEQELILSHSSELIKAFQKIIPNSNKNKILPPKKTN